MLKLNSILIRIFSLSFFLSSITFYCWMFLFLLYLQTNKCLLFYNKNENKNNQKVNVITIMKSEAHVL